MWPADLIRTSRVLGNLAFLSLSVVNCLEAVYVDIYMEAIRWDNAVKLYEQYGREAKKRRRL